MAASAGSVGGGAPRKLRVLMLHGFMQSAPIFRAKTAAVRKSLDKVASFDYLQAPLALTTADAARFKHKPLAEGVSLPDDTYFAWWKFDEASQRYTGWERSVQQVRRHVMQHGAPDVYMGFSQGASFLSMLAALASAQRNCSPAQFAELTRSYDGLAQGQDYSWFLTPPPFPSPADAAAAAASQVAAAESASVVAFSAVPPADAAPPRSPPLLVLVSGFMPRVAHLRQFYPELLAADGLSVAAAPLAGGAPLPNHSKDPAAAANADLPLLSFPSLHVIGRADGDVSPLESDALRRAFLDARAEVHDGGHVFPCSADFCRRYKSFFAEKAPGLGSS